ncbi:MAG: DUF4351 domain-containing protein [Blastocatellia bacterium]
MKQGQKSDQDGAWKEILNDHFEKFVAFFFPRIHAEIDWSRGYVFLDKELAKLGRRHTQGKKLADKLAQVWLKDGSEVWVLLHVEVQGQVEEDFNLRVYVYNYKIVDRFGVEVISLAVVTGSVGRAKLGRYETGRWGCRMVFDFPVAKITDWRGREAELEASDDPFAMVVLAQLRVLEAKGDAAKKYDAKRGLIRLLFQRGWQRPQVESLLRFIDRLIALPEDLEDRLDDDIEEFMEGRKMEYITSWERRAEKRGVAKGLEIGEKRGKKSGRVELIFLLLEQRLGEIDAGVRELVEKLTLRSLDRLAIALIDFSKTSDLVRWLKREQGRTRSVKK